MMERLPENGKMRNDCDQEVNCGKGPAGFPDLRSGSQEACVFVRGMSVQTLGCAVGFRAQNSGDKPIVWFSCWQSCASVPGLCLHSSPPSTWAISSESTAFATL